MHECSSSGWGDTQPTEHVNIINDVTFLDLGVKAMGRQVREALVCE